MIIRKRERLAAMLVAFAVLILAIHADIIGAANKN
jgi:hypothetical protein